MSCACKLPVASRQVDLLSFNLFLEGTSSLLIIQTFPRSGRADQNASLGTLHSAAPAMWVWFVLTAGLREIKRSKAVLWVSWSAPWQPESEEMETMGKGLNPREWCVWDLWEADPAFKCRLQILGHCFGESSCTQYNLLPMWPNVQQKLSLRDKDRQDIWLNKELSISFS